MEVIQKVSGISLYYQVMNDLLEEINNLPVGSKIPTEKELMLKYGVSRGTIRQAINELVAQGQLYKIQGSGTFKGSFRKKYSYFLYKTFTEQILAKNQVPGISNISLNLIPANSYLASKFGIPGGQLLFKLSRLRLADNRPIAYYDAYVRQDAVPDLQVQDLDMSLLNMFETRFHHKITINQVIYHVASANKETALLLGIPNNFPILKMESTGYTDKYTPFFIDFGSFSPEYSIILNLTTNKDIPVESFILDYEREPTHFNGTEK